ncbi:hypothetical protein [Viridibacillus arvi]|uniref:hypothetical protein n=1 Tax=Viridibacillus arvi TaxID=263475 RepID=UPI0034CE3A9A
MTKTRIFQFVVVCIFAVVVLKFVINDPEEETKAADASPINVESNETSSDEVEDVVADSTEESEAETPKSTLEGRPGELEDKINDIISSFDGVSVKEVEINDNIGTKKSDDYITLLRLSYDAPNEAETSKKLINLYNNEIGADLANEGDISKLVIFWEVPYLQEDKNSAKAILVLKGKQMIFDTDWYDPSVY